MDPGLTVTERAGALRIAVRVKPRSSRSRVLGVADGVLSVALEAAPVEGEANAALVALLAKALGVRRSRVSIALGASGRRKLVDVRGISRDALLQRLGGVP